MVLTPSLVRKQNSDFGGDENHEIAYEINHFVEKNVLILVIICLSNIS